MYLIYEEEQIDVQKERELNENPELEPIKKFLLIQQLKTLNDILKQKNILNDSLTTFLYFCDNLSFDTIVSVSNSFIDFIDQQLQQGNIQNEPGQNSER